MKRRVRRPYWATPGHRAFRSGITRAPMPTAAWLNEVQAEMLRRIEGPGVSPEWIRAARDAILMPKADPSPAASRVVHHADGSVTIRGRYSDTHIALDGTITGGASSLPPAEGGLPE